MIRKLRIRLIAAAKSEEGFVHYDEVAEILGVSGDRLDRSHAMNQALEDISTYENSRSRPMLTAVVVHKNDLRPGQGFFVLAKRLGKFGPRQDRDEFYLSELARIRRYWREQNRNTSDHAENIMPSSDCGGSTITGPGGEFRLVFATGQEPNCRSGRHITERFRVPDNARVVCAVLRRRTRLIPLNIFRRAYFEALLRDIDTEKLAKSAMKEGRGKLRFRGKSTIFGGKTIERDMVIQNGGEYYLEVRWGSLIRSWEIGIYVPTGR
jgi:hypothetical protein